MMIEGTEHGIESERGSGRGGRYGGCRRCREGSACLTGRTRASPVVKAYQVTHKIRTKIVVAYRMAKFLPDSPVG